MKKYPTKEHSLQLTNAALALVKGGETAPPSEPSGRQTGKRIHDIVKL